MTDAANHQQSADQPYRPVAHIRFSALRHNLQQVRRNAPNQPVMAMVKANAYGHGAVAVAKQLLRDGVNALAVARLDEALALRRAGVGGDIVILEGLYSSRELAIALKLQFDLVLHDAAQITTLLTVNAADARVTKRPLRVWLKLETGMHRLGLPAADSAALAERLRAAHWCREVGWLTHLACADDQQQPLTTQQLAEFLAATRGQQGPISLANSAANIAWPAAQRGWQRPGIMLYGGSPGVNGAATDLQPVMRLQTRLLAVKMLNVGDNVGYGASWQAQRPSRIGIAAIGYGDGYPRALSSAAGRANAPVWIAGQRCPLIGRVSMDKIAVDLSDHPTPPSAGAAVELWGKHITVDELAELIGTIGYELLSGLTERVERIHAEHWPN